MRENSLSFRHARIYLARKYALQEIVKIQT